MRIVTRPDFDGIVCAVMLLEAEDIDQPIEWMEPNLIQSKRALIKDGDIIANLPYDKRCTLWFDHHVSNMPKTQFQGAFEVAPSAAGVIYHYYKSKGKIQKDFNELIHQTDIIDAAQLNEDQVLYPEKYPYIILSMTIKNHDDSDPPYWNKLVSLLRNQTIDGVLEEPEVKERCQIAVQENEAFTEYLKKYTSVVKNISITDFRPLEEEPLGNRFLVYSLFPETMASIKIRYRASNRNIILLSIGHSIFNRSCNVNVGRLLSRYGGGGHAGAGGCTLEAAGAQKKIDEMISILIENKTS